MPQVGEYVGPPYTPGQYLTVAGPDSWQQAPPNGPAWGDGWRDMFVTTMYDLDVMKYLRPQLIFDQFAVVRDSRTTHNGQARRIFFRDDLPANTTPLYENLDVDSQVFSGRYVDVVQRQYGTAVTKTELVDNFSMVAFDPEAAEGLGYNAGLSQDTLAMNALFAPTLTMNQADGTPITGTVGTLQPRIGPGATGASAGYLSSEVLQEATVMLGEQYVAPYEGRNFIAIVGDRGEQHLRAESGNAGWRDVVKYNEGGQGNSIFLGEVGTYEGVRVIVDNRLQDGEAIVFGRQAFVKVFPRIGGRPNPQMVMSPPVDKLNRFRSMGWKWTGGYSLLRPQALVRITHTTARRPFGAENTALIENVYSES